MQKVILAALLAATPLAAEAQGLHAVQPIPGYICMMTRISPEQAREFSTLPRIMDAPTAAAHPAALASAIVIVRSPLHVENGFAEVLQPDGKPGWLQRGWLAPYPNRRGTHCTPSMMSNGRPGIG